MLAFPYGKRLELLRQLSGIDDDGIKPDFKPDFVLSADFGCSYCIHLHERFVTYFPEVADLIADLRICIPMLHIQNHQDKCMYWYCSAYLDSMGHFHGETAEHQHPELNKLGAQLKQMNHGHRHDKLNSFHGDWNWRKTISMSKLNLRCLSCHLRFFTH